MAGELLRRSCTCIRCGVSVQRPGHAYRDWLPLWRDPSRGLCPDCAQAIAVAALEAYVAAYLAVLEAARQARQDQEPPHAA